MKTCKLQEIIVKRKKNPQNSFLLIADVFFENSRSKGHVSSIQFFQKSTILNVSRRKILPVNKPHKTLEYV